MNVGKFIRQKCYVERIIGITIKSFGKWKNKSKNIKPKFIIRNIKYYNLVNGKMKITCSGMPESCYKFVTFDNFKTGLSVPRETYL